MKLLELEPEFIRYCDGECEDGDEWDSIMDDEEEDEEDDDE